MLSWLLGTKYSAIGSSNPAIGLNNPATDDWKHSPHPHGLAATSLKCCKNSASYPLSEVNDLAFWFHLIPAVFAKCTIKAFCILICALVSVLFCIVGFHMN